MPQDYYSSPVAAMAEHDIGYSKGHMQGRREGIQLGHNEGYQQGVAEGRQAALRDAQQAINEANNLANSLATLLGAAADALLSADDAAKVQFALKYSARIDRALANRSIQSAPHANARIAGMSLVMRLIDESRRAVLRNSESSPSP